MSLAKDIIEKKKQFAAQRQNHDILWKEIGEFILPNKSDFVTSYGLGHKNRQRILDTTAEHAIDIFASSVIGFVANPTTDWLNYRTTDDDLNKDKEVKDWLETASETILAEINRPEAGFYSQLKSSLLDIGAFGTTSMLVENGADGNLLFRSQSPRYFFIAENAAGKVDTLMKQERMTYRQLVENADSDKEWNIPAKIREKADVTPFEKLDVIKFIYPNPKYREDSLNEDERKFKGVWVLEQEQHVLKETGFFEFPEPVGRWDVMTQEVYGRGPAEIAIADVKMLQSMVKSNLMAAEAAINPPLQIEADTEYGSPDFSAGAINFYQQGSQGFRNLADRQDARFAIEAIQAVQDQIRRSFFVDQLQLVGTADMTATEVLQRQDEKGRLLAPSLGRVREELIGPIMDRALALKMRDGTLPPVPEKLSGQEVRPTYISQLEQVQRANDKIRISEFIQNIAGMAQVNPESLDKIDFDAAVTELHDIDNLPASIIKDDAEVDALRQQRAQQQQLQQQADLAQQGTEIAKNASDAGIV